MDACSSDDDIVDEYNNELDVNVDFTDFLNNAKGNLSSFSSFSRQIFQRAKVTRFTFRHIPNQVLHFKKIHDVSKRYRGGLLRAADHCLRRITGILFPSDGDGLYTELLRSKSETSDLVEGMVGILKKTKKGSVEKKTY